MCTARELSVMGYNIFVYLQVVYFQGVLQKISGHAAISSR